MNSEEVWSPRVKEILDGIMTPWEGREGRSSLPGIYDYYWETPKHLANDMAMARRFIESGVASEETHLVQGLRLGFGTIPRNARGWAVRKRGEGQ